MYFGGNSELRGYDYLQFAGQNVVFANAELRFPLIEAALTPIGVIGGIRGVFFAGIGGAWFNNQPTTRPRAPASRASFKFVEQQLAQSARCRPAYKLDADGQPVLVTDPVTGVQTPVLNYAPQTRRRASACRTAARRTASGSKRSRSASRFTSTGRGGRSSTRTGKTWCSPAGRSTATGACVSGADEFRKPRFAVWIGYDF